MPEIVTPTQDDIDQFATHHNHTFIQWKGTDVCMDWWCPTCGTPHHVDADFCYKLKCLACQSIFEVGESVTLTRTSDESGCVVECPVV